MSNYSCSLDPQLIQRTVLKIVADHLGLPVSELRLEDDLFRDLGADDLDQKELMITVEERFGIRVKNSDVGGIKQVRDIVNLVQKYCVEKETESGKYKNGGVGSSKDGNIENGKQI
jgi:acyl carrier protein